MIIYIVNSGDTLYSIARKFGLTVAELERFNLFNNPQNLSVGQDVLIPVNYTQHTVQKGESLYSIASEYGITLDMLLNANPEIRPPYTI